MFVAAFFEFVKSQKDPWRVFVEDEHKYSSLILHQVCMATSIFILFVTMQYRAQGTEDVSRSLLFNGVLRCIISLATPIKDDQGCKYSYPNNEFCHNPIFCV